jgi:DNA-binding MarR family transcriptional regulator
VDDLERRGLVVRSVRPGDRRSKMVSITPPGQEQARLAGQILAAPPRPVRELAAADLATLERILGQLLGPDGSGPDATGPDATGPDSTG